MPALDSGESQRILKYFDEIVLDHLPGSPGDPSMARYGSQDVLATQARNRERRLQADPVSVASPNQARDAGIDVAHVGEVHVLRHFVNAHPWYRLPRAALVVIDQLLDLGALVRAVYAGNRRALRADDEMTSHARADCREPRVRRFIRRVVAVEAVHAEPLHVHGMREVAFLG